MTLRRFLNCAYALIVDQFRGFGVDLLTAVERANASIGLATAEDAAEPVYVPSEAENSKALRELQQMMGGLTA